MRKILNPRSPFFLLPDKRRGRREMKKHINEDQKFHERTNLQRTEEVLKELIWADLHSTTHTDNPDHPLIHIIDEVYLKN